MLYKTQEVLFKKLPSNTRKTIGNLILSWINDTKARLLKLWYVMPLLQLKLKRNNIRTLFRLCGPCQLKIKLKIFWIHKCFWYFIKHTRYWVLGFGLVHFRFEIWKRQIDNLPTLLLAHLQRRPLYSYACPYQSRWKGEKSTKKLDPKNSQNWCNFLGKHGVTLLLQ